MMWRVMDRMTKVMPVLMKLTCCKRLQSKLKVIPCALGDAAAWPIQGLIRHFRHEIENRINKNYNVKKILINGKEHEFEDNLTLIQALN